MISVRGLLKVQMIGSLSKIKTVNKEVMRKDNRIIISKVIPYKCRLEILFYNTKEMKVYKGSLKVRLNKGDKFKLMLIASKSKPNEMFKELDAIIEINGVTRLANNFMKCGIN